MFKFVVFDMFCWLGLCAMGVIFISDRRKKSLSLRSFLKMAKNRSPEKWVVKEDVEDSGFYEIDGLAGEYSTEIAGFCLKIGKYPIFKKSKNGKEIICYSYRMFALTKRIVRIFQDDKRIAKAYNQIHQERRRMERVIEKWRKGGARIEKSDVLASA